MKILKKIALVFLGILMLLTIGGYFYFNQKFAPEKNYLIVENESGKIPIKWLGNDKNVLLLPIHFPEDSAKYYLQFDTGSPYTVFYINSAKIFSTDNKRIATSFFLGNTKVSSSKFKIFYNENHKTDSLKIIGTLGADILEGKKTLINIKENYVSFNLSKMPENQHNLFDFQFEKRKIIIPANLKGKKRKFLYDSGTSAYEMLTNKEEWEELRLQNSKITVEKAKSWEKTLTVFTANCNQKICFNNKNIQLKNITYVEGFSKTQYYLMKFSGMTGMLGNKIFLKNKIYIDCVNKKIGIE